MVRKSGKLQIGNHVVAFATVGICMVLTLVVLGPKKIALLNPKHGEIQGVQTNIDRQIKAIQSSKIVEADKLLASVPNPIVKISMEGKAAGDLDQKATVKSLADVKTVYTLGYVYTITRNPKYLSKVSEFMLAWAKTYKASGNPIDESHLQPLFEGYGWTRAYMSQGDVATINAWLNTIAAKEMKVKYNDTRDLNNWNSHRINVIGQIGYLIDNNEYVNYATSAYKEQIENNLHPNGSSYDFEQRDALHYHSYNLWPLLFFAKTSALHGRELYDYTSPSGASLRKSVHFLFPYFSGEQTHIEFVNTSVAWDKKNPKKLWIPKNDLYILELAYFFDDETLPLIQKIKNNRVELPSFETMVSYTQRGEVITISTPDQSIF